LSSPTPSQSSSPPA
jgi:hypothetical protein